MMRLHSAISTLSMYYDTTDMMHLQYTFPISWVLIIFQGTVHSKCSKWPPPDAGMRTFVHELSHRFEGPGAVANSLRSKRNPLVKCVFSIGAEYIRDFKCPNR